MTRTGCIVVCVLLFAAILPFINNATTESDVKKVEIPEIVTEEGGKVRSNFAELPAWDTNFKWKYRRVSDIELDYDGYLHLVDEAWYVVSSIDIVTCYNGYSALAYNVTIEDGHVSGNGLMYIDTDDPPDGEPDMDVTITVDEGQSTITGFQWYRVSDLAMMHDYRDIHAVVDARQGVLGGTAILDALNSMQASPPEEDYDFPIRTGDHWKTNYTYHNYVDYSLDLPSWINGWGVEDEHEQSTSDSSVKSENWCNRTETLTNDFGSHDDCYLVDAQMMIDEGSGKQKWWYYTPAKNFARWRMENMNFAGMVVKESNNDLVEYDVWDVSTSTVSVGPGDSRIAHPGGKVPVKCDFASSLVRFDEDLSGDVFSTEEIGGDLVANVTLPSGNDNTIIEADVDESRQDVGSHGLLVQPDGSSSFIPKTITLRNGDLSLEESDVTLSGTPIMAGETVTLTARVFNLVDTYIGMDVNVAFYMDWGTQDEVIIGTATLYGMDNGPAFSRFFTVVWSDPVPGNHTITALVDWDDLIDEPNEENNIVEMGAYYINTRPTAKFTPNATEVLTYENVFFDGRASFDVESSLVEYLWNFGDGKSETGKTAIHNYTNDDVYNASLKVTDSDSVENTYYSMIKVSNRKPVLVYTLEYEGKEKGANIGAGDEITFDASGSYDMDGFVSSIYWDFGVAGADSYDEVSKYTYQNRDIYTVTLTVTDDDGDVSSTEIEISVANKLPVIDLKVSDTEVPTLKEITFDASGTKDLDPQGSVTSFWWDFDDGTDGSGSKITHAYLDDGVYDVVLTVIDNEGGEVTNTVTVKVSNQAPVLKIIPALDTDDSNPISLKKGLSIDVSSSFDADGNIEGYYFDSGEGGSADWGMDDTFHHIYDSQGTYTLVVKIKDDDGVIIEAAYQITVVDNNPPTCSFTFTPEKPEVGEKVTFKATFNDPDPKDTVSRFMWNFGADNPYNDLWFEKAERTITYKKPGNFTVTLTVETMSMEDSRGMRGGSDAAIRIYGEDEDKSGNGTDGDDGPGKGSGIDDIWLFVALGAVLLVIIIVVILIIALRGKKNDEDEGEDGAEVEMEEMLDDDEGESIEVEW